MRNSLTETAGLQVYGIQNTVVLLRVRGVVSVVKSVLDVYGNHRGETLARIGRWTVMERDRLDYRGGQTPQPQEIGGNFGVAGAKFLLLGFAGGQPGIAGKTLLRVPGGD